MLDKKKGSMTQAPTHACTSPRGLRRSCCGRECDNFVMIALVVLEADKQCLDLLCGQLSIIQEATTRAWSLLPCITQSTYLLSGTLLTHGRYDQSPLPTLEPLSGLSDVPRFTNTILRSQ